MSFGRKLIAVAVAVGLAFASQPAAIARDVLMPYPLIGLREVDFEAGTKCAPPGGKGYVPFEQSLYFSIEDDDSPVIGSGDFDLNKILPYNTATVHWKNKATGQEGTKTVHSVGRNISGYDIFTGVGEIEATLTITRSIFPENSSVQWFSTTHTETFTAPARDAQVCKNWPRRP